MMPYTATRIRDRNTNQKGVALAMLLWFVAAMTILVAGIVAHSRSDIKVTQLQLQKLQAEAAGDGASLLLLRDLIALQEKGEYAGRGIFEQTYTLGTHNVRIRAIPVSGLIDLNMATNDLLIELFDKGASLGKEHAQDLVDNISTWRVGGDPEEFEYVENLDQIRSGRFEVPEDLLLVEGMTRKIYDSISQLIHVALNGQAGVDPVSAPQGVLAILIGGDNEKTDEYMQRRLERPFESTELEADIDPQFIATEQSPLFRLDAKIKFDDGVTYQRTRWVWIEAGVQGDDGLPWRVTRTEPITVIEKEHSLVEAADG